MKTLLKILIWVMVIFFFIGYCGNMDHKEKPQHNQTEKTVKKKEESKQPVKPKVNEKAVKRAAWYTQLEINIDKLAKDMKTGQELFAKAKLDDSSWKNQIQEYFDEVNTDLDTLINTKPFDEKTEEVYNAFQPAWKLYQQAMDLISQGVETQDAEKLLDASDLMLQGNDHVTNGRKVLGQALAQNAKEAK